MSTTAIPAAALRRGSAVSSRLPSPRYLGLLGVAVAVFAPLGLVLYQSFLSAPFYLASAKVGLAAYRFVLSQAQFWRAFGTTLAVAAGMVAIAVPLGSALAFLFVRTDLPAKRALEPLLLVPLFLSPIVVAFGYVVAVGPVGFVSLWVKGWLGYVPWTLYSLPALILIAGLTHAPHIYLYNATALSTLNPELEEAARTSGAKPWHVALSVSLPLARPALLFGATLVFLLGFEMFGLPLVLGDPAGLLVLTTYLFKLTNLLGTPSYQMMAVVAISIVLVTLPLVYLQRRLLGMANRYVTVRGKGQAVRPLALGAWRWPALALVLLWLGFTVALPLSGVVLRSMVRGWGEGVHPLQELTLEHFGALLAYPNLVRGVVNTLLIGTVGGAVAVAVYALVALSVHRWSSPAAGALDYLVLLPRAMPGLVVGLAFLWVFLFFKPLVPLRSTPAALWLAYSVVWLAYGLRLITTSLLQIGTELEESARVTGAGTLRATADVTLPLIRFGLIGSWLLIFMMFVREYSTGVYLLGAGTEVIGSLIVSLSATGALDIVSALSVVSVALVALGLGVALRLGIRLHA